MSNLKSLIDLFRNSEYYFDTNGPIYTNVGDMHMNYSYEWKRWQTVSHYVWRGLHGFLSMTFRVTLPICGQLHDHNNINNPILMKSCYMDHLSSPKTGVMNTTKTQEDTVWMFCGIYCVSDSFLVLESIQLSPIKSSWCQLSRYWQHQRLS